MTAHDLIATGTRVLRLEREALAQAEARLGPSFARAVELIAASRGRVIIAGVGKSGLIGRKIAATMTSTGTPATFLHPVESVHGDLGIVGPDDVAILLSKSGETVELFPLLDELKRLGVQIVAITGNAMSTLGRAADAVLDGAVSEEACPHDLAPTTSTTVALALGDALAVALLEHKGFRREDFARLHPGGALGRKLAMRVHEIMETERLPVVAATATLREAIVPLAERRGLVVVDDGRGGVGGVVTAGDLARLLERSADPFVLPVHEVMTASPRLAQHDELASAVVFRMERFGIMAMPVVGDGARLVGIVHLHDLMRAGVA
ncbi:MAG: KpsF/GutQ family sugar-phosphate isomerase [Gemmatimonadaceae bacterium]|nr:KpsF/GutQ family sugar-phosphate isomerase [Gemmatimonadaceae bacterium]